jgi:uncharacterized protein (TIGR02118 family)
MATMIKMVAFLKRKQGMTRQQFLEYWTQEHTKLSVPLGMKGYRINIALDPQPDGTPPLYDGTCEIWWESLDHMRAALDSPQNTQIAGPDVANFAEVAQFVFTEEFVIV